MGNNYKLAACIARWKVLHSFRIFFCWRCFWALTSCIRCLFHHRSKQSMRWVTRRKKHSNFTTPLIHQICVKYRLFFSNRGSDASNEMYPCVRDYVEKKMNLFLFLHTKKSKTKHFALNSLNLEKGFFFFLNNTIHISVRHASPHMVNFILIRQLFFSCINHYENACKILKTGVKCKEKNTHFIYKSTHV